MGRARGEATEYANRIDCVVSRTSDGKDSNVPFLYAGWFPESLSEKSSTFTVLYLVSGISSMVLFASSSLHGLDPPYSVILTHERSTLELGFRLEIALSRVGTKQDMHCHVS